jgi:serine/threonine protein kinase
MDIIFLVMDFTNNDMKKVLLTVPNGTKLYEDHVIVILYNLLCCLNYLHSANLMHRDLKPANILLDDSSQVLVCDFGISRTQPIRKP